MLALLAIASLAAACGDDDDDDGGGGDSAQPQGEQILRVNMGGEAQSLDPQRATDTISIGILENIYSGLLRLDQNQDVVADAAAEVPTLDNGGISEDGLTYTFKLHDDLKWSDGTDLVAQDFVNGAKRLFEPGSGNFYVDFFRVLAADGKNVEVQEFLGEFDGENEEHVARLETLENAVAAGLEVSAPNDQTVVYQLNRRSPVFLLLTTMWPLYPVRQDIVDANGEAWTEAATHVSNGPFRLVSWNHGEDLAIERNDEYHGEAPILDRVEFDQIPDFDLRFLAYEQDELDVVWLGPTELVQVRGTGLEDEFLSYATLITLGFYFNVDTPGLDDVKVRQALAGAIDREEYANIVLEGAALPAYGWVPPGMPGHDPEVGRQYQDAIERSQELLAEAGYPGGEGLEFEFLTNDGGNGPLTAEWLKDQWQTNLGVTINVTILERATYFAERNAGNYEMTGGGWGADYPDPQNWLPLFRTGGLLNNGNFSNARFDELLEAADEELDNDKRIELYLEAQRVMLDQLPFAPMNYRVKNILVKPWVHGLVPNGSDNTPGDRFFDFVFISKGE